MNYIDEFQETIRRIHGVDSDHVESVMVAEPFQGKMIWNGQVEVFDLHGHPETARVYAWTEDAEDPDHPKRHVTVLHISPVTSPSLAVRTAILENYRKRERPGEN